MAGKKFIVVTRVVFRKTTSEEGGDEIVAFFPDADVKWGNVLSYAHEGQHGEVDFMFYLRGCRKCTEAEYAPLKKELEDGFGYVFKVLKRIPSGTVQKHWYWRKDDEEG